MLRWSLAALLSTVVLFAQSGRSYGPGNVWWNANDTGVLPWEESYDNPDGQLGIWNQQGAVHTDGHPFFTRLGANGRACVTCHQPSNAMSVSAASLRERWAETAGKDPVFAAIDGSNCPDLPQGEKSSHSLLLDRGLFRIALAWPPEAKPDFRLEVVRDPTGCNTSPVYGLAGAHPAVSIYRRPRVAANLTYRLVLMADGREPSLEAQASTAARVHAQAQAQLTAEQLRKIIDFENQIYVAQSSDIRGGRLNEKDGPVDLGAENLVHGKANIDAASFEGWRKRSGDPDLGFQREFRASVARGANLFQTRTFRIRGELASCATCHRSEGPRWTNIDTTNRSDDAALPLFRVTCDNGRVVETHDPGRALISGKCTDVGAIVTQQLRGLAARAPYFADGSAPDLRALIDFYDGRFSIGYTAQEKQDLENFLRVL